VFITVLLYVNIMCCLLFLFSSGSVNQCYVWTKDRKVCFVKELYKRVKKVRVPPVFVLNLLC